MRSSGLFEVEVVSGPQVLDTIGEPFDELHRRTGASLTQSRRWLSAWVGANSDEPHAVVVRNSTTGAMSGAALFGLHARGGVIRVRGLGHGLSDHVSFMATDAAAADALASGIVEWLGGFRRPWLLHLEHVVIDDLGVTRFAAALATHEWTPGMPSPWTVMGEDRSLEAHTKSRFRRNRNRAIAKLKEAGHRMVISPRTGDEINTDLIEQIEHVRRSRDDDIGILSELDTRTGRQFWHSIVDTFAASGELVLQVLEIDDRIAAYCIGFRDGSTLRMWDSRIDPDMAEHSPGLLLHLEMLEEALSDIRLDEIDWGRGDSPSKRRLADELRPSSELHAWSSENVRRAHRLAVVGRTRLVAIKDRNERVRRLWMAIRARTK